MVLHCTGLVALYCRNAQCWPANWHVCIGESSSSTHGDALSGCMHAPVSQQWGCPGSSGSSQQRARKSTAAAPAKEVLGFEFCLCSWCPIGSFPVLRTAVQTHGHYMHTCLHAMPRFIPNANPGESTCQLCGCTRPLLLTAPALVAQSRPQAMQLRCTTSVKIWFAPCLLGNKKT